MDDRGPYVVQCSNGWAIVECRPEEVKKTVLVMSMIDPFSVSLLTSGTIISLRRKYPNLQKSHVSVGVK
ncbi:MAG: hypothetical protein MJY64_00955 [archaeon]|nr:hypothetical protein [archaeon]